METGNDVAVTSQGGEVILHETTRQPYANCCFSAGLTERHPIDTVYLRFEREGEEPTTILLRADEALAVVYVLTGAVWSLTEHQLREAED